MANELYLVRSSGIVWTDSGGDEVLALSTNGDAGDVAVGAYHDFGPDPRPDMYELTIKIDGFTTAPVIGETINTYITESEDASLWTGPEAPSNTAETPGNVDRLPNLLGPFPAVVRSTVAGDNIVAQYQFRSGSRYIAPVVHNKTADKFQTSTPDHRIIITPLYWQVQ